MPVPPSIKKPTRKDRSVRELLIDAGHDVSEWNLNAEGEAIANPNNNLHRNTAWSFPGRGSEPVVVCLWWNSLRTDCQPAIYEGNDRAYRQKLLDLDKGAKTDNVRKRLRKWTSRSRNLDFAIQDALKYRRPVKVIMVDGDQRPDDDAERASEVHARELDTATWWVRDYDDVSIIGGGKYHLVRGEKPDWAAIQPASQPELVVRDVADDPALQQFLETLEETEREAVIKARVGQGPFRDALFARWGGCSVCEITMPEILTASHIKPWSRCDTAHERVSVANGLLLSPTLDRLFDRGLITFDDNFRMVISKEIGLPHQRFLQIDPNTQLRIRRFDDIKPYLAWHRDHIFRS